MGMASQFLSICSIVCIVLTSVVNVEGSSVTTIQGIIPSNLVVPAGSKIQQSLFGVGVQIYTNNGSAWLLTNVSADLYNFKGLLVGHHFFLGQKDSNGGQASWETFQPTSRVTVKALASVQQTDSIPWLLLQATSNTGSQGEFGSVTIVQRLFTQHGLPPNLPNVAGNTFDSNYTALYSFYT